MIKHEKRVRMTKAVYAFVEGYYRTYGYMPTRREVADRMGCSTSVVDYHLRYLVRDGRLVHVPRASRGLALPTQVHPATLVEPQSASIFVTNERAMLRFVDTFIRKNGVSPSIRQIVEGLGLSSTSQAFATLIRMKGMGWVTWKPFRQGTLTLTAKGVKELTPR